MKEWLRLTLITLTIGGGFAGVLVALPMLTTHDQASPGLGGFLICLGLYGFMLASGIIFAHNPRLTTPLMIALALQVPWVSSPLLGYRCAVGVQVSVGIMGGSFSAYWTVGSAFGITLFQTLPWGIGVNLFALTLLILLVRAVRKQNSISHTEPRPADDPDAIGPGRKP